MWVAEQLDWRWPTPVVWAVAITCGLVFLCSTVLFLQKSWRALPERPFQRKFMGPLILFAVGIICIGTSAAWYFRIATPVNSQAQEKLKGQRETLPGISVHLVIKINDVTESRRKFVFDFSDPEGAHAAFYLSASNMFVFEVTDIRGEKYPLEIPIGRTGIPFGEWIYLVAEVGVSSAKTNLAVLVNGYVKQSRTLSFAADLGSRKWENKVVGANANSTQHGGFSLAELIIYSVTPNDEDIRKLKTYIFDRYAIQM